MTPDNVSPPALSNNAVSSVLDFSTTQKTREVLTGQTVIVGGKTYTFFVNVFPKDPGPGKLLDPREIAAALVSAINLDVDGSGVYYDAVLLQSANSSAEAYARGSVVTIVSRTGGAVVIGGDSGGTPTIPAGSGATADTFDAFTVTGAYVPLVGGVGASNFMLDNLDTTLIISVRRAGGGDAIQVFPRTGREFSGSPTNYEVISSGGNISAQLQMRYN